MQQNKAFWKRPIGERLVVYLAICDFSWSLSHFTDHVYTMVILDHIPDIECAIFAFLLMEFAIAQTIIVLFTGMNAFLLVVREFKINLGLKDHRLLILAFGSPALLFGILAILGYLGPTGA